MPLILPQRPAPSSAAHIQKISQQITLTSNLFPMKLEQNSNSGSDDAMITRATNSTLTMKCFQYDIAFEPSIEENNRPLRYKIFNAARPKIEALIGKFSFSGKSLFTLSHLNSEKVKKLEHLASVDAIPVDGVNYTIRINFTKEFDVSEDDAKCEGETIAKRGNKVTQVINVVLKQIIRDLQYQEIGKNSKFFDLNSKARVPIKDRNGNVSSVLIAYKGFQFGTTPTANKMYLMVDYASRILREETALEFLSQFRKEEQERNIVGDSVITEYNNFQIYKIDRIDFTKTPNTTFLWTKINQQISYANYYKQRYNIVVRELRQPLLVHIRKFREPNTNIQKTETIYLIPEICQMTGMTDEQRSNRNAMKDVAQHTKLTPDERFNQSACTAGILAKQSLSSGIRIDTSNSQVQARILNPPSLSFGKNKRIVPDKGNFEARQEIFDQVTLTKYEWGLIYHAKERREADSMLANLQKAGQIYGIRIEEPIFFEVNSFKLEDWINILDEDFQKNALPMFLLSMAGPNFRGIYQGLKKFLYNEVGLEHQNVNPRSLDKNTMSVASKIALQISAKLGKRLWTTEIPVGLNKNTMLIGIETSMKKVCDKNQMKQAIGVVATVSNDLTKFYSEVDVRSEGDTSLPTLSSIIKKSLSAYNKNTKSLPEEIIIYRQGLGEGQVIVSLQYEIEAIRKGCSLFREDYSPRFAFFQVNKKIGQKFYQEGQGFKGGLQNPTSGSIVTDQIVGKNFEFFLCAQNCNSGVCTPTKYTCLHNNTKLAEDTIWQLTYFQCYNYYNWQGPVRVPAPMMYAGKLAKFTSDVLGQKARDELVNSVYYL